MQKSLFPALAGGLALGAAAAWFGPAPRVSVAAAASRTTGALYPVKLSGTVLPGLAAAWTQATSGTPGFRQRMALLSLVMQAQPEDMPRLLALSKNQAFARELLLRRWVEQDAAGAGAWIVPALKGGFAELLGGGDATMGDVQTVLQAWARMDPRAALDFITAEAGPFNAGFLRDNIIESALAEDMESGVKLLSEAKSQIKFKSFGPHHTDWVSKNPAKAARLLATVPAGEYRNSSLARAIAEVGEKDLAAGRVLMEQNPTLGFIEGQPGNRQADPRGKFFEQWAKADLPGMTAFLNDKAEGPTRAAMKEAMAKTIGEVNPRTALEWAADNLSGERRKSVLEAVLGKLANDDPPAALEYLGTMPKGSALDGAVDFFNNSLGKSASADRLAQARALPDSPARAKLLGNAYQWWYAEDPQAAIRDLAKQPDADLPEDVWRGLGGSSSSLSDGMKQLSELPADRGVEFVSGLFARHSDWGSDPTKTAEQLTAIINPDQHRAAIDGLTGTWVWRDRAGLVEWAAKLPDASERQRICETLSTRLQQLPEGERTKLLGQIKE